MLAPNLDDVKPVLNPHIPTVVSILHKAWRDWMDSGYAATWEFKRNRANFVWAQMATYAREAFENHPQVHIVEKDETLKFLVNGTILFRLKKGTETGLTSNIPTQQVLAYHDHEQDLFGMPAVQRVDVVYILNVLETDIQDILVVARNGKQLAWTYSLLEENEAVDTLPFIEVPAPANAPGPRLVKAKTAQRGAVAKPQE